MNCSQVRNLLGVYLYEDLESSERDSVEQHLRECEECQSNLEALRATVRRIPTDLFLPGEQTHNRVMAQCRDALVQTERQAAQPINVMFSNRIVQVGITALLFFAVGTWIGHQMGKPAPATALHSIQSLDSQPPAVQPEQDDVGAREIELASSDTPSDETGPRAARRTGREPSVSAPVILKAGTGRRVEAPRAGGVDDARLAGSVVAVIE